MLYNSKKSRAFVTRALSVVAKLPAEMLFAFNIRSQKMHIYLIVDNWDEMNAISALMPKPKISFHADVAWYELDGHVDRIPVHVYGCRFHKDGSRVVSKKD